MRTQISIQDCEKIESFKKERLEYCSECGKKLSEEQMYHSKSGFPYCPECNKKQEE